MSNPHSAAGLEVPPFDPTARIAVVLLHGRTHTTRDVLALAARIALPSLKYIAVQAAGGTWYPKSFLAPPEENEPWLGHALDRLEDVVVAEERDGFRRERIVLLGFSQGACLACEHVRRHPRPYAGLVALTGGVIGPPASPMIPTGALEGTPVLLTNGDADPWVPLWRSHETAELFRSMGATVDERVYRGRGHEVVDDEIDAARALLSRLIVESLR
jgi:phospholipase/carboxylesterase